MHPRVSLHQVAMMASNTAEFISHCRSLGVSHTTLVTPKLMNPDDLAAATRAIIGGGIDVATINHPFASFPNLDEDAGTASAKLIEAIDTAAELGAGAIYLLSGGRGSLDWEVAADRFAELIAPCLPHAAERDVTLLVENANVFNADIHIAHTLADAIRLAEIAGIGVCIDLHACWTEGGLDALLARAMPLTGLVQVSDYVLGDRSTPCRAVPGDGAIPLRRLLGTILGLGYKGVFDLELIGPRIEREGAELATARAAQVLSDMLFELGA